MSAWDKIYCQLCENILTNGVQVANRTGIDTIKLPSAHFQLNVGEEFPILTTKQLFIRQAVLEMLWIYQAQSNDVRWLQERNVHIWDLWQIDENGDWRDEKTGEVLKHFDPKFANTIGTAYGYIVKRFKLMDRLIDSLKNNVNDRRRVISLWQDEYLDTAVLPSCVWSSEWDVTNGTLNAWVHQRSCDVPLGLPFNVTQYAVLLKMLAQVTGLKAGTIDWSIKDAHIYVNQVDGIKEQLERFHTKGDLKAPELWLNPEIKDFYDFDSSKDIKDIKLIGYEHMGKIKFPLAQ
ncbi:thymidylate synthase [Faecalitalea cylindroides]|uniref:thymidylate synthase n=1 Tax=Faecalitalea cylindroides TaxID=39483 RepID=UPI002330AA98|nr:thymidylate synthase [Faecalitalea cylindroides]MDB7952385.1 thymidylate synthase [Faecalitalea cylindroides]MDB7958987.1 thymidylate synthase [Faecalitalea cylindroides]MDB7960836.1 thymidylate synthase [Faecalitalea cylindroides]MDB7962915.1 thymidylate synthase [Faecalitalea cylindroides]MDB7964760.1 thymidylate synthase [Faecalitalea cylindroides]